MLFVETATDEVIAAQRAAHESVLDRALAGCTPEIEAEAQAIDWGLHNTIVDALGNGIITNAYRVNAIKMRLIRQERIRIDGLVVPVMREHLHIIDAIETRDPMHASKTLIEHINNARNRALDL